MAFLFVQFARNKKESKEQAPEYGCLFSFDFAATSHSEGICSA